MHPALHAAALMLLRPSHDCVTRVDEDKRMPDAQADRPAPGLLLLAREASRTLALIPSTRFQSWARSACMQMQSGVTERVSTLLASATVLCVQVPVGGA
jgi:hypothetical protein